MPSLKKQDQTPIRRIFKRTVQISVICMSIGTFRQGREDCSLYFKLLKEWELNIKPELPACILGYIRVKKPAIKLLALKPIMDALPVKEANKVQYASKNKEFMHACGHDVHMSSLLITARILKSLEAELAGTVKLIFQPSEEKYPVVRSR